MKDLKFVSDRGKLKGMVLRFDVGDPQKGGIQTSNYFLETAPMKLSNNVEAIATISTEELKNLYKFNRKKPVEGGLIFNIGSLTAGGQIRWNKGIESASGNLALSLPFASISATASQNFDPSTGKPIDKASYTASASTGFKF